MSALLSFNRFSTSYRRRRGEVERRARKTAEIEQNSSVQQFRLRKSSYVTTSTILTPAGDIFLNIYFLRSSGLIYLLTCLLFDFQEVNLQTLLHLPCLLLSCCLLWTQLGNLQITQKIQTNIIELFFLKEKKITNLKKQAQHKHSGLM